MGREARGPGPPSLPWLWLLGLVVYVLPTVVFAEKNKLYNMDTLCKEYSLQPIYRKVDGAFLKSQNEKGLECIVTFQTHTILQKFLLRFDLLQLDCNDHLFIYDSSHAVGDYTHDLSCANTQTSVGAITTRSNFVTLKYVTDTWGTDSNGFHLVITAVKNVQQIGECEDFLCKPSGHCVSRDLLCDGFRHCKDASDETSSLCSSSDAASILGIKLPIIVIVAVSAFLMMAACAVGAGLFYRRRLRNTPSHTVHQIYSGSNGTSTDVGKVAGSGPGVGNSPHPAALGYLVVLVRLFVLAE